MVFRYNGRMTSLQDIESAIKNLPVAQFAALRDWLLALDNDQWDKQLDADAKAGKLDALIQQAREDARNNRCTDL